MTLLTKRHISCDTPTLVSDLDTHDLPVASERMIVANEESEFQVVPERTRVAMDANDTTAARTIDIWNAIQRRNKELNMELHMPRSCTEQLDTERTHVGIDALKNTARLNLIA